VIQPTTGRTVIVPLSLAFLCRILHYLRKTMVWESLLPFVPKGRWNRNVMSTGILARVEAALPSRTLMLSRAK
jgi:hypothetical protein